MSNSDFNKPTGHGIYFSGNFEIEGQVSCDLGRPSEYRTYVVYINCGGADRDEKTRYEIRASGFSSKALALKERKVYFLRGLFFPTNTVDTHKDHFYFEGSDRALIGEADDFRGETIDTLGVTGIGTIVKLETIVETCNQHLRGKDDTEDPKTIVATVEHTDYHPAIKPAPVFRMEYRVRPYKYLSGAPKVLKLGRECLFHGYLKDFNEDTSCYIVIANRISTSSGHRDPGQFEEKVVRAESGVDASGRSKPKKFVPRPVNAPFQTPIIPSTPSASAGSGPANYPTAPDSDSDTDIGTIPQIEPPTKKRVSSAPSKKRSRTRAARRTSSNSTLDLTT